MKISVLLPTRGRPEALMKSVRSLHEKMSEDNELEFLFALDRDDALTLASISELKDYGKVLITPRYGYKNLHLYYNDLCAISTGEWLFLWNDDTLMETHHWDKEVEKHSGQFLFLNPKSNHPIPADETLFPIVPKKYYELVGHFSLNCSNDTWVQEIGRSLGLIKQIDVEVVHDRADMTGKNNDTTYQEREYQHDDFFSEAKVQLRNKDIAIIQTYLNGLT